jgi:hypothetical protein
MQNTISRPLYSAPRMPVGSRTPVGVFTALLILAMPFAIFLAMIAGDDLLRQPVTGFLRGIWPLTDSLVHFVVGLLVVSPILLHQPRWLKTLGLGAMVFAGAVLIDLDHAIAAGSLSLYAVTHLSLRPPTHSLAFALALGLLIWLFSRRVEYGWLVFAALFSHFVRDASTGGMSYFLWPVQVPKISLASYHGLELLIFLCSGLLIFTQSYYLPAVKAWASNRANPEPQRA